MKLLIEIESAIDIDTGKEMTENEVAIMLTDNLNDDDYINGFIKVTPIKGVLNESRISK